MNVQLRVSRREIFGVLLLSLIALGLLLGRPYLAQFLPAADLAYLLRDGRYLILFQNNNELRALGGFIGSYAEIEVANGLPKDIQFGTNIYKLDEPFTAKVTIPSPAPLSRISQGKWSFRDSNWAADGPEAARQVLWFYERETGKKVDGVIALTTTVMEELLRLTGPIEMPEYSTTLTADDFAEVVQYKVEREYFENRANWEKDEPKTILKDLIPILQQKALALDKKVVLDLIFRLLDEKSIVLYTKDPLAQGIIIDKNWGGRVDQTRGNYLYLVNSNIDGGKSSRKVEQSVTYTLDTGKRQATVYIERHHTGSGLWPDSVNRNWIRILVPRGSKLVSARMALKDEMKSFDIGEEAGKTVFGIWMNTNPQETQDLTVVYELTKNIDLSSLVIQRQPGANPDQLRVFIDTQSVFDDEVKKDTNIAF